MTKILIVEDETAINNLIKMTLSHEGYSCSQALTAIEAMNMAGKTNYDLVLLDVNLPDLDGFSVYKHLGDIPVIFVTARDEIDDRLKGFCCGAEDYIVKPFDLQELLARVRVVLRRHQKENSVVCFDHIVIDMGRCEVEVDGTKVELTNQEYALLSAFASHKNQTLTREQLLDLAWGINYEGELRTVDVHVRRLREKLGLEHQIVTVYKVGYRLEI